MEQGLALVEIKKKGQETKVLNWNISGVAPL
jgi:hypothetical protein